MISLCPKHAAQWSAVRIPVVKRKGWSLGRRLVRFLLLRTNAAVFHYTFSRLGYAAATQPQNIITFIDKINGCALV